MLRWLRRGLEALLALVILFEEWGWEPLHRAMVWIGRWPPIGWLERRIAALPPYAAVALFLVPTLMLLPIKIAALWLIGKGRAGLGLLVIVVAKVGGTALVARLFQLTQPALMRLAWFAQWYGRWTLWKEGLLVRVRSSWAWRVGRVVKRRIAHTLARWRRTG
jgi:hypothetical protein